MSSTKLDGNRLLAISDVATSFKDYALSELKTLAKLLTNEKAPKVEIGDQQNSVDGKGNVVTLRRGEPFSTPPGVAKRLPTSFKHNPTRFKNFYRVPLKKFSIATTAATWTLLWSYLLAQA